MLKVTIDDESLKALCNEILSEITDYIFMKSQDNIVTKNIIDEGTLLKTANIIRDFNSLHQYITYPVPYAENIEFGRLPGSQPPVDAIRDWVQRKLSIRNYNEANRIAWAIAIDIKQNGMQPRPFLTPALQEGIDKYGKR